MLSVATDILRRAGGTFTAVGECVTRFSSIFSMCGMRDFAVAESTERRRRAPSSGSCPVPGEGAAGDLGARRRDRVGGPPCDSVMRGECHFYCRRVRPGRACGAKCHFYCTCRLLPRVSLLLHLAQVRAPAAAGTECSSGQGRARRPAVGRAKSEFFCVKC